MRLCIDLGCAEWPEALARIERARESSRVVSILLFAAAERSADREVGLGWLDSPGDDVAEELAEGGFPAAEMRRSRRSSMPTGRRRPTADWTRPAAAGCGSSWQRLLRAAAHKPSPATMIERVLRVLDAIGARSSYLALLKEQPAALDRLIDICAISGFLARQIADFPLLLDELIDAKAFDELPSRARFARELAARTERLPADDPEREVEALRVFQKVATFSVALADLTGRLPLMQVSDRLTDIAELIVQCCMDLAWTQMTTMHGSLVAARRKPPRGRSRWRLRATASSAAWSSATARISTSCSCTTRPASFSKPRAAWTTACSFCGWGSASCIC